jgi:hypothetical protein
LAVVFFKDKVSREKGLDDGLPVFGWDEDEVGVWVMVSRGVFNWQGLR